MIRLAADEDFNNDIVRALRGALPDMGIVGVREAGHAWRADPEVLAWAALVDAPGPPSDPWRAPAW